MKQSEYPKQPEKIETFLTLDGFKAILQTLRGRYRGTLGIVHGTEEIWPDQSFRSYHHILGLLQKNFSTKVKNFQFIVRLDQVGADTQFFKTERLNLSLEEFRSAWFELQEMLNASGEDVLRHHGVA